MCVCVDPCVCGYISVCVCMCACVMENHLCNGSSGDLNGQICLTVRTMATMAPWNLTGILWENIECFCSKKRVLRDSFGKDGYRLCREPETFSTCSLFFLLSVVPFISSVRNSGGPMPIKA